MGQFVEGFQAGFSLLHHVIGAGDGPLGQGLFLAGEGVTSLNDALLKDPEIPAGEPGFIHEHGEGFQLPASGQGVAGLTGLGDLQEGGAEGEHIAHADFRFEQLLCRKIFAESPEGFPRQHREHLLPVGIVLRGIGTDGLVPTAMDLAIAHGITLQSLGEDLNRTGDLLSVKGGELRFGQRIDAALRPMDRRSADLKRKQFRGHAPHLASGLREGKGFSLAGVTLGVACSSMKTKMLFAVLLGAVGLMESSFAADKKKLIIGTDATYPPFEALDESGQPSGASIDMGRELAKSMGREAEFRNINFDGLIAALKSGSIDCVISSMTANDERRKSIDFSDPYVKTGLAILVSAKSPVQSIDDLKVSGRRLVVRLGTTGEQYVLKHLTGSKHVSLDSDTACVMEVVNAGADAWIYDQLSLMRYHERHPKTTRALLKPIQEEVWAIGIKQGNDELKTQANTFLKKFREEGGFTRLAEKHLAKEKKMMEAQGIPFVFDL